ESGGISRKRMWRYGKKNTDSIRSMKIGRLPSIIRRFVQTRPWSSDLGVSKRSTSSGCSFCRWRTTFRITSAGVVEVDHEPDAAAHPPHTDPHATGFG